MHGGARFYTAATPVVVRRYYRAPWGTRTRQGLRVYGPPTREVSDALAEAEAVVDRRAARRNARLARRAAAAAIVDEAEADAIEGPLIARRRRRRVRRAVRRLMPVYHPSIVAAATVPRRGRPRRSRNRNIYFVRNAQGVRVPVFRRPRAPVVAPVAVPVV